MSGLEQSLEEFEYVAKKFKREKSDIQILKDTLIGTIEKMDQKQQIMKISVNNLAKHWVIITELLCIINSNHTPSHNTSYHNGSMERIANATQRNRFK